MRVVIARCQVDYAGRLTAHLPMAPRLIIVKADGSVSVHADDRAYKPLNWMSPPCTLTIEVNEPVDGGDAPDGGAVESAAQLGESFDGDGSTGTAIEQMWRVVNKAGEELQIAIAEVLTDVSHELGVDPGLVKDGVEAHLQELLALHVHTLGDGWTLVRREFPTPIGPVDLMCRDADGSNVAVEIKRRGEIDGVEQLTRYLDLLNRDPALAPVAGVFAAQEIKPQARLLAEDRGIRCLVLDYDELRGVEDPTLRLF